METDVMITHLIQDRDINQIGLFFQNDAFGLLGKAGILKACAKHGARIKVEGTYDRNVGNYESGAKKILEQKPEAIVLVGAYKPCAAAIQYWKKNGFKGLFLNISFVGSLALAKLLKNDPRNVYITQVMPSPWESKLPIVKEYREALKKQFCYGLLEGFLSAKIMHLALKKVGKGANSEVLKHTFESMGSFDLGGLRVSFSPTDHRALDYIALTKIERNGAIREINTLR